MEDACMSATTVNSVLGPVPADGLGRTLMHEHLLILGSRIVLDSWPALWDRDATIAVAVADMHDLKQAGIDTIVDMTTIDVGRDIEAVAEIARRSPVQIVACTGIWIDPPRLLRRLSPAQMADCFVSDIEDGIQRTGIRAGILKVASETGVDELNENIITAVAQAHRRTGVPINTHSSTETGTGPIQQDVLERNGVDLSRVIIGHCGDTTDIDYLGRILERGSSIGMDRFGLDRVPFTDRMLLSSEQRVAVIAQLCKDGYAEQIVLGHDAFSFNAGLDRDLLLKDLPTWTFRHIPDVVLPMLRDAGVSQEQVKAMLVDNPHRLFSHAGPY
jgi:phosphotriesterase-related protein